jgi:hypothetical protein
MRRHTASARRRVAVVETTVDTPADFADRESQRVLSAAARAVAHELGRAAAREWFAEWIRIRSQPK